LRPRELKGTSRAIFAGLAGSYDRTLDMATFYQDRRWKDWVARRLSTRSKGLVLDIGCGTLVLEERLARLGSKFVGVDLSPEMVGLARAKGTQNLVLLAIGDAEHLPFPDASFDSAVSCYVPKYVDPGRFAAELARVTRAGADVLVYDFAKPSGAAAPFLEVYIQGVLRAMGSALGLAGRGEAAAFRDLPWIIDGTRWDHELPPLMEHNGFQTMEKARLTGGSVFAYWGRKARTNIPSCVTGVRGPLEVGHA
jgi:demethylmenaquinone methyltransferase/2-methoxy-6-polyprenyl-1,4-benzoquinol methylase